MKNNCLQVLEKKFLEIKKKDFVPVQDLIIQG